MLRLRTLFLLICACICLPLLCGQEAQAASYTYITLDAPEAGTSGTSAYGINNAGTVVGDYTDGNGVTHGFSRTAAGVYTTLNYPGAANTSAHDINNAGTIVGTGTDASFNALDGFSFSEGNYTSLNHNPTWAYGINDAGTIVGDAIYPPGEEISAIGINNTGDIVGVYINGTGIHGFSLTGGAYTFLDHPDAIMTNAYGINDYGDIVGTYVDGSYSQHAFVLSGGVYTTLNLDPLGGDAGYSARGINDAGMISGFYMDANGTSHGFLTTPVPEPATICLLVTGGIAILRRRFPRNDISRPVRMGEQR